LIIYNFLLALYSIYMSLSSTICETQQDIGRKSPIENLPIFPYPICIRHPRWG